MLSVLAEIERHELYSGFKLFLSASRYFMRLQPYFLKEQGSRQRLSAADLVGKAISPELVLKERQEVL